MTDLTKASEALFLYFWNAAPDWSGTPLLDDLSNAEKGNLSDLKTKSLLATAFDEGVHWVFFTDEGEALGEALTGKDKYGTPTTTTEEG